MWCWSFDAIIYPFNEVILEGLASFKSWCPDHRREAIHSLLWFYTDAQGVGQAELRRRAVPLRGISSSEKLQGEEEDSLAVDWQLQIRAPQACLAFSRHLVFSGDLQVTGNAKLLVRTNRSPLLPGWFPWRPVTRLVSPIFSSVTWTRWLVRDRWTLGCIYLVVF